jgi:hypothetical protein
LDGIYGFKWVVRIEIREPNRNRKYVFSTPATDFPRSRSRIQLPFDSQHHRYNSEDIKAV